MRKTHKHGPISPTALECDQSLRSRGAAWQFTRAGEELNVTHGAVSRQIRLLEDWLGTRLFLRTSRSAVLTQVGMDLFAATGPALDRLAAASHRLQSRIPAAGALRVSALPTFAMRWLIPRLPEFQRNRHGLELQIVTASTPA